VTILLSKEEFDIISHEKATIVRGVVYIPTSRMGEFCGFECYLTKYFTEQQLSECLRFPEDYPQPNPTESGE
jgi:hypothetical protein